MEFSAIDITQSIAPDKSTVMQLIGCGEGDRIYKSVSEEYDTLFPHIVNALDVRRSVCCDGRYVYVSITAGSAISELSESLFAKGEGLAGLIVNAAADSVLFCADEITSEYIKHLCGKWGKGIRERLEAPDTIPLSEQKKILENAPLSGVSLTEGMMLSPIKTMAYKLVLTDDKDIFNAQHDCSRCTNKTCPRRSVGNSDEFKIISEFAYSPSKANGVCVDIGTTTIAAVRFRDGELKAKHTELNSQRRFGADVLSRIEAVNRGRGSELKSIIEYQLKKCIEKVGGADEKMIVCANTAMTSILMGYDCSALGVYPFKAQSLDNVTYDNTTVLGGISAFVGGDILSGLYMCSFDRDEDINIFVDLGTNAEMAIGNCEKILCTSAAAGPAFEGGGISCGCGSVDGAVYSVSIKENSIKTIGQKKPIGICGSGITELVSELKDAGYIDDTGCFKSEFSQGYKITEDLIFTQKDLREFQTAKSAVRTGIEILIQHYGTDNIKNIYIAGGFGKNLNIEKACNIGLLPERFKGRYKLLGNSSLGGGVKLLEDSDGLCAIEKIKKISSDFPLAEDENFSELFMKYMDL